MNKLKKEKGITLIALVVTIIVLIILAGISINLVLGNNGIITKARDARSNFARAANEEQTGLDALLAEMNEKIDGNSSKGTLQIPEELKVGDTISYTPSGSYVWDSEYYASTDNDGSNSYPDNFLYTGNTTLSERRAELEAIAEESRTDAQKKELAAMENAKDMTITSWRVLSIDRNNNTVKLVPAEALGEDETDSVFLQGAQGYNNGVYLIKEACERLYSDSSKGATAESITIEDIENAVKEVGNEDILLAAKQSTTPANGSKHATSNEGFRNDSGAFITNKSYPLIYENEQTAEIDGTAKNGTLGLSAKGTLIRRNASTSANGIAGGKTATTSIRPTQTYYYSKISDLFASKEGDSAETAAKKTKYSEIFSNNNGYYWVASRCVLVNGGNCNFYVRNVGEGKLDDSNLFGSNDNANGTYYGLFPVVSLSSGTLEVNGENYTLK